MSKTELYQQRIQRKIYPGDKKFNVNTLDFNIADLRLFFHNGYCYDNKYDFILIKNNTLKIGLQHQHLSKGIMDQVVGAGSLIVNKDGLITYLDNQSGTFQFNKEKQDKYLNSIHKIIQLNNAKIYEIDYKLKHDPDSIIYTEVHNPFYGPIKYNDNAYKNFIRTIDKYKSNWVLRVNRFNEHLYKALNSDFRDTNMTKTQILKHFIEYGQYEPGRCIGYYE